jgi:hypothetical protein
MPTQALQCKKTEKSHAQAIAGPHIHGEISTFARRYTCFSTYQEDRTIGTVRRPSTQPRLFQFDEAASGNLLRLLFDSDIKLACPNCTYFYLDKRWPSDHHHRKLSAFLQKNFLVVELQLSTALREIPSQTFRSSRVLILLLHSMGDFLLVRSTQEGLA